MDEIHVYKCSHLAPTKFTAGNNTRLSLLVRSSFPPARASLWPKHSGTTTWPQVALLSAMLQRRMNRVTT